MNFHERMTVKYIGARMRLVGRVPLPGTDLLPRDERARRFYTWSKPHRCLDPVPNQCGVDADKLQWLRQEAEFVAVRRSLAIFARMQRENPCGRPIFQLKVAVATAFKMDSEALYGRRALKAVTRPRQIAMMLAMRLTKSSSAEVGRRFGRDHTTVLYAEKKFAWLLDGATSQIGGA